MEARLLIAAAIADLFARPRPSRVGGDESEEQRRHYLLHQAKVLEAAQRRGLSIKEAGALLATAPALECPVLGAAPTPVEAPPVAVIPATPQLDEAAETAEPTQRQIKIPGGLLAAAALRLGHTDAFAFWCAAYSLDIDNGLSAPARGWVLLADLKAALLPLMTPDRFYRLWRKATAANFVTTATRRRDGATLIYYRARLKLGLQLELDSLGEPVWLPWEMLAEATTWKAALFAAVHVGRARAAGPIAREILQALTGLPARTQRHYEARMGITAQPNLCLSELAADHLPLMQALDVRPGCFTYYDKQAKAEFIAWHLPNSYQAPATCARARSGMNRNINRFLRRRTRLINGGWQCAVGEEASSRFTRIFWAEASAADRARRQAHAEVPGQPSACAPTPPPEAEAYVPRTRGRTGGQRFTKQGRGQWQLVPGSLPMQLEPSVLARQLAQCLGQSE